MENEQIVIYQLPDGKTSVDVKLENDSIWLNINQIGVVFGRDKSVISRHLSNIFNEGELERDSTVAKNATVQKEGKRTISREIEYYNLDAIISIGYRVNSKRGTQFRIWANQVLKEYLLKGYVINQKRLNEKEKELSELKQAVNLLGNVIKTKILDADEATGLLNVITDYTYALDVLDQYDHQILEINSTTSDNVFQITYPEAIKAITGLKNKFGGSSLFANEKD
ncbi:MAG: RhuM family protein, partial [Ferruginibacter sp.]